MLVWLLSLRPAVLPRRRTVASGCCVPDALAPFLDAMAASWTHTCTRVFYATEAIAQPCFGVVVFAGSALPVCQACATTCFLPEQVASRSLSVTRGASRR
jgi:hypothetical protein